jgi:hypothetical protein
LRLFLFIYRRSSAMTKWLVLMQLVLIWIPPYHLWEAIMLWLQIGFMVREALKPFPDPFPSSAWKVLWWLLREAASWPHMLFQIHKQHLQ